MKKFFAGIISAMLLVAMMGTTVFASPSPGSDTALRQKAEELNQKITSATGIGSANAVVVVTTKALDDDQMARANAKVQADYTNASVLAMTDVSVPDGTDLRNGVKITFSVTGVLAGDNIIVLHQKADYSWETLTASVGNGTVTVTMRTFSPIVIIRLPNSSSSSGSTTSSGSSSNTSTPGSSNTGSTGTPGSNNGGSTVSSGNSTDSTDANKGGNNNSNDDNSVTVENGDVQNTNEGDTVDVNQNVTVDYPDNASSYGDGYKDGYAAGQASVNSTSASSYRGSTGSSGSGSATSPKTGEALPALPIIAVFAIAGIIVCGRKARNI
jgi:hypothetical protein